jgi:hypothetical protein
MHLAFFAFLFTLYLPSSSRLHQDIQTTDKTGIAVYIANYSRHEYKAMDERKLLVVIAVPVPDLVGVLPHIAYAIGQPRDHPHLPQNSIRDPQLIPLQTDQLK